jgi:phosphatidylglycerophosphate synthase
MDGSDKENALASWSDCWTRGDKLDINGPTRITLSRILLVAPFIACMLHINDPGLAAETKGWLRYTAIGIYLFMAVGDGLDGLWARRSGRTTTLGAFLDPVADKLLMTSTCLLLISEPGHVDRFVPPTLVVVVIIGKDVLLTVGFLIACRMTSHVYIHPVFAGKLAAFLLFVVAGAVLLAPEMSRVIPAYDGLLSFLWWSAAATSMVALIVYIRDGVRYIDRCERARAKGAEVIAN